MRFGVLSQDVTQTWPETCGGNIGQIGSDIPWIEHRSKSYTGDLVLETWCNQKLAAKKFPQFPHVHSQWNNKQMSLLPSFQAFEKINESQITGSHIYHLQIPSHHRNMEMLLMPRYCSASCTANLFISAQGKWFCKAFTSRRMILSTCECGHCLWYWELGLTRLNFDIPLPPIEILPPKYSQNIGHSGIVFQNVEWHCFQENSFDIFYQDQHPIRITYFTSNKSSWKFSPLSILPLLYLQLLFNPCCSQHLTTNLQCSRDLSRVASRERFWKPLRS